jgi:hypothetical protein
MAINIPGRGGGGVLARTGPRPTRKRPTCERSSLRNGSYEGSNDDGEVMGGGENGADRGGGGRGKDGGGNLLAGVAAQRRSSGSEGSRRNL